MFLALQAPLTLERKAEIFTYDLEARFRIEGQVAPKLRVATGSYNMPDNCYMTGIYLGTEALRLAVTRDPRALANVEGALAALERLEAVTGTPGFLARAYWPAARGPHGDDGEWSKSPDGRYLWRGDVSNDQVTGFLYGASLAFDLGPASLRPRIALLVARVVDRIQANGRQIVDAAGKVTTWGRYDRDYVVNREPMNALLWLQHLAVARQVTGEERFRKLYEETARRDAYARFALVARKATDPLKAGAVNHSDDVLLFLAYLPLFRLEKTADLRDLYLRSLDRTWREVAVEENPFFTYVHRAATGDRSHDAAARRTLELFPFDLKWNRLTIAGYERRFGFRSDALPRSAAPARPGVVPIDRRPRLWSAWANDPYVAGSRETDGAMEYQALDFLMAYWLGRYTAALQE